MKNKKTIIILILVLFVGIVGITLAYFANSTSVDNIFNTQPYGTTVIEEFTSPSNWLPGDTTSKVLTATNTGNVDEAVRIRLNESWETANNGTLNGWIHPDGTKSTHTTESELASDERVAIINFDNASDWTYNNGYYYYNYKLAPNESTSSLIKSVTFNSKTKLGDTCVETPTATGRTITCNSSGDDYDNATYTLTFNIETVQYNKYNEAWNLNNAVAISETKQRMLKGLKVNVTDATFETGDKTAMFEFSHPATAQTPALTDYRYIGHMPNNYVKFNCDNDGTNCEIWRIIGVFSVDDGEGNWEQRIKLVRGSALPGRMRWDDRECSSNGMWSVCGINDWNDSKINIFLNGDYLTKQGDAYNYGLKELAQTQIDDARYYLGGRSYDEDTNYGSTNDMYDWERGTEVYNENVAVRNTFWKGKIGLFYPSDYGYTYSKGVDNECFSNLYMCHYKEATTPSDELINNHPEAGWIYNSNNLEGTNTQTNNWLLSTSSNDFRGVFGIRWDGVLNNYSADVISAVRPVLYLKSSINIISGEGTEQNPYIMSISNDEIKQENYTLGSTINYNNTNYCVIKDSTKTDDYITLIKSEPLTYDELVTHNNGYEIERNNEDNNVGVMHYYKGGTCESETNGSGCSSLTYEISDVKQVVDNWGNSIKNDLMEVNGYKVRLITYDELADIGYKRRLSGTQYVYYSDSDTLCSTNIEKFWTERGAVGMSLHTFMYFQEFGAVRPVINLKKCALDGTC